MSVFDTMTLGQLRDAEVELEKTFSSLGGNLLREHLQNDLTASYGDLGKFGNILSNPEDAEANLRAQGKRDYLEVLFRGKEPWLGLRAKLEARRAQLQREAEEGDK